MLMLCFCQSLLVRVLQAEAADQFDFFILSVAVIFSFWPTDLRYLIVQLAQPEFPQSGSLSRSHQF